MSCKISVSQDHWIIPELFRMEKTPDIIEFNLKNQLSENSLSLSQSESLNVGREKDLQAR